MVSYFVAKFDPIRNSAAFYTNKKAISPAALFLNNTEFKNKFLTRLAGGAKMRGPAANFYPGYLTFTFYTFFVFFSIDLKFNQKIALAAKSI